MKSSTTCTTAPGVEGQAFAPVDAAPIPPVVCPEWCAGDHQTTVTRDGIREVVHNLDVYEVQLRGPGEVVRVDDDRDLAPGAGGIPEKYWPGGWSARTAVVALVKFDEWAADGTHTSSKPDIVVDGPEGVMSLTPDEATRLGAALIRAAAEAR